jgi:succinate dehydrogenase / fumarate reductase, cytochrome b subunit
MKASTLLTSSIGKKLFVALAGLFLMVFLLVHLGINLLLLRNDGGEWYMAASHFMSSNWIIKIFEVVLFGGFLLHMIFAIAVTIRNWIARPVRYQVTNKSETSFFSKYMFHTGVIVLGFLLIHFIHFFFVKLGWVSPPEGIDKHDFYTMAIQLFKNIPYTILYLAFFVFLGFHLNHALQSAFQTLGFQHNRYSKCIEGFGTFYAVLIAAGYAIIPLYIIIYM